MLKKYFLIVFLIFISNSINAQKTYVPDDNFEQALIDLGYDDVLDDYVVTANINGVDTLKVQQKNISDLTGIEDFISLISLHCYYNQLTSLNLSNNISLTELSCYSNELTSIDVTQNPALRYLKCCSNQLISLDVSKNPNLECLICTNNKLTTLDLSKNPNLTAIFCDYNELISLNIKNGNNSIFPSHTSSKQSLKAPLPPPSFNATNNPSLTCIQVDNETDANNGMVPYDRWKKDATATYSEDCQSLLGIDDEILSEGLNLYPNPVTNMLTINSKLSLEKIEVYSVLGQKMKEVNSNLKSISTDNLSRGIYFIKIYSEKGKAFRKLIKQ